ncbi:hypothetical protein FA95DRAFT_1142631 [Auriscalpium vulgare]|uniref:Uncharacterized protein n=1 Tax=Auriscalpium vulgare TaxID=40419 RepID=A0ACB8R4H3_9AGAM|nr:hypothetical protein FA95DRAFT_1142631 [Auriscalpium vulgare]
MISTPSGSAHAMHQIPRPQEQSSVGVQASGATSSATMERLPVAMHSSASAVLTQPSDQPKSTRTKARQSVLNPQNPCDTPRARVMPPEPV